MAVLLIFVVAALSAYINIGMPLSELYIILFPTYLVGNLNIALITYFVNR